MRCSAAGSRPTTSGALGQEVEKLARKAIPGSDAYFGFAEVWVGKVIGCSLHGGASTASAGERKKRNRLCRHTSGPAVSRKSLALIATGAVHHQLESRCLGGTKYVVLVRVSYAPPALSSWPAVSLGAWRAMST